MKKLFSLFLTTYFLSLCVCAPYTEEKTSRRQPKSSRTIKPIAIDFGDTKTANEIPQLSSQLLYSSLSLVDEPQTYLAKIEKYYENNPSPPLGTSLLMNRYKNLFNQMYDQHIKNSTIGLYYYADKINDEDLLKCPVSSNFLTDSLIIYQATKDRYQYQPHKAYVDFANRLIGGGVMHGGFVQEEIMLLESTFLPLIAEARSNGEAAPLSFAPAIPLNSLDSLPVVLKFRMFNQIKIYGNTNLVTNEQVASNVMVALPQSIDIYAPAMAAPDLGPQSRYSEEILEKMYKVALRAFYTTLVAQFDEHHPLDLHTGNWGAGVFGNSIYSSWAIQRLAAEAAYMIFSKTKNTKAEFNYSHDAYDEKSLAAVNDASQMLSEKMAAYSLSAMKPTITAKEVMALILALSQQSPKWQVGYKIR